MSIKFAIKNSQGKSEMEGDSIVRFTGVSEPFRRVSSRDNVKIGVDAKGNPKVAYITGLDEKKIQFLPWYNAEEKKVIQKQIKELKPIIADYFGGPDVIDEQNAYFWGEENRDVNRITLTNDDMDVFYDTKNPIHALLYLSVVSGAFRDLIAPTREWAERHPDVMHYLVLDTEDTNEGEEDITRSDAHAALADLRKNSDPEGLFILAWCIQYDTNAFGAYHKSIPYKDLVNYHIKYIDGKIVTKKKRDTAKVFLDYVNKWNAQQTRPGLFVEAYVKSGEYFNFIQNRNKKYISTEGTDLGSTMAEVIENLQKPRYATDFESLRDKVEAKWKE